MTVVTKRSNIDLLNSCVDISCIGFSDDPECNNCHGEIIGEICLTPDKESYDSYRRYHGQLVRIFVLKGDKNAD